MHLGIRWRLTLWNTLALAVVLVGFAALIYFLLAHVLYQRLDRILLTEFQELANDPRLASQERERVRYWIVEFKEHENVFAVVYAPDGTIYERTAELAADSVPPPPARDTTGPFFRDAALPLVGRQRVLQRSLQLDGQQHTMLLMAPLAEADHELERLLQVSLMAVPVALVTSAGLGYFLARKAMRPVEQMRFLTQEITAERLSQRLPVSNPRDELGQLAVTINGMIGRLERSFAEIRRFTADASHELRTPLTAIRTETEVALRKPLQLEDCQPLLGSILEECDRLTRLTDQLLMLSREDIGTHEAKTPVDLTGLVRSVVETMRGLAEAKGLRLTFREAGMACINGDDGRLRQVFFNLLDNAIKYTPQGGTIDIGVGKQDHTAVVKVTDTGVGIPPEHLPHVFERFYRVDKARTRQEGGTGLGLAIAQSIVHAHGGQMQLVSTPGQGTTFTVFLPEEHLS